MRATKPTSPVPTRSPFAALTAAKLGLLVDTALSPAAIPTALDDDLIVMLVD